VISSTLHTHLTSDKHPKTHEVFEKNEFEKKSERSSFYTLEITQGTRRWIAFESHSRRHTTFGVVGPLRRYPQTGKGLA
jgi:hypothetical protein